MDNLNSNQIIVTVSGKDKVGIVSSISDELAKHGVNIEDIKQTIMQDNFIMIMLCNIKNLDSSFKDFKDGLVESGQKLGMEIWVQKKELFDKMHTI